MRDGAARGGRPVLRRARDEGVRRGLGARPAPRAPDRVPSGRAHGLPAAAERRLGARRVRAGPAARRSPSEVRASSTARVRPSAQDARELARARRCRGARAGRRGARGASAAGRTSARRRSSPASSSRSRRRSAHERLARGRRRPAKLNLALVVGPDAGRTASTRWSTVLERLTLADTLGRAARRTRRRVDGFDDDTLVRAALDAVRDASGTDAALRGADRQADPGRRGPRRRLERRGRRAARSRTTCSERRSRARRLHELAAALGADVPFFLRDGPQLATGDGTTLEPLALPRDYAVLLGAAERRDEELDARRLRRVRRARRRAGLRRAPRGAAAPPSQRVRAPSDLAALPANDLASSPLAAELDALGAFRADVTGAGPAVYGLFASIGGRRACGGGARGPVARTWVTRPAGSQGPATVSS